MGKGKYLDFKDIKKHVRELRKDMTDSEKLLWRQLRNRQLSGYKFLRQHPIIYKADYKGLRVCNRITYSFAIHIIFSIILLINMIA